MSTSTASSTITSTGTPVHQPPSSPRVPGALLGANMLEQYKGIMGLPEEQQGERFLTVFGNLITKIAANHSAHVLSVPNAGTAAHAPTSVSVLEFESNADSVDTDPLIDVENNLSELMVKEEDRSAGEEDRPVGEEDRPVRAAEVLGVVTPPLRSRLRSRTHDLRVT
ncbi:hypothetical protein FRC06_008427 [Ceratobasidium sp. 370]|nr:hypothetical protein FRC06_008427 [Ceratobasidium sp. 370]